MNPIFNYQDLDWKKLTECYEQNGFAIIRNVFSKDFIDTAREHVLSFIKKHPEISPTMVNAFLLAEDPVWISWTHDPKLLKIVEAFFGPNLALFASNLFAKPPHVGVPIGWHQDGPYWKIEPLEAISVCVALTVANSENGGLMAIPNSHRGPFHPTVDIPDPEEGFGPGIPVELFDKTKAYSIDLNPGDISLHHPLMIHASSPNRSSDWRISIAFRYIPTTTKILDPYHATPFLLQGKAVPGINIYLPWPSE